MIDVSYDTAMDILDKNWELTLALCRDAGDEEMEMCGEQSCELVDAINNV